MKRTPEFYEKLEKYAEVGIKVGLNVQPGQRVVIRALTANLEFTRALTRQAYLAGASFVNVLWEDEGLEQIRFKHAPDDSFEEHQSWVADVASEYLRAGDAYIRVFNPDPVLFDGFDPEHVKTYQQAYAKSISKVGKLIMAGASNRLAISAPTPRWAAKVMPDAPEEERVLKMWDLIFDLTRINTPDPVVAWEAHIENLIARSEYFNQKQYKAFKFTGPGTDLTIGMPKNHYWGSALMTSKTEIDSVVNIPTEEVFCGPDRNNVNGTVAATMPLNMEGALVDNIRVTFKDGRVVEAQADVGQEILDTILNMDDSARYLGEIALVPHSSPISQTGRLFYNTLFDENASSHIALGSAYRQIVQGGKEMTDEEFMAVGGNISKLHVDFMIGSEKMDVDGLTETGQTEPVMRAGEWAFEVK